jgi:2-C-methyl-D-erythritol 4-phosphate cytidylyltransferase / 2-C-methyl-D-erythritol 2,4-cyclodiphosphate synthase
MVYGTRMTVAAVIVAGGSGLRAGGEKPKQYQLIGGKPVVWWTLQSFLQHPAISHVQVVVASGHEDMFKAATAGLVLPPTVTGGASRQDSCRLGLESCASFKPQKVLIHDAARPFVTADLIQAVVSELDYADAVIPGLPVADTMKFAPGGTISKTVDRAQMWFVQTPQGFSYSKILDAHRRAAREEISGLTDDASVAEFAGIPVRIIAGDQINKKLTTNADVVLASQELQQKSFSERPDIRTGQGIDFHVFATGKSVTLCGVVIPHTHKLKGHSDADVALHALTDAILGAIGEGDIGTHFPPSDMQWKNAASAIFVQKAMALLQARGGVLANVDITILAEAPKISPHIAAMKAVLTPLLHLSSDRIAIKATTTEKLGAIGRKEGMAAFAIATVRLPL